MIGTIGSLVQETSARWKIAIALHVLGALSTAASFGALLALAGRALVPGACAAGCMSGPGDARAGALIVGGIAATYAASDLGLVRLPRPVIMYAVPVTWWRRWQPYGASLLYGAALGVGVTTRIPIGAFYALCALCVASGNPAYGALLLGTYGAARSLALVPASHMVYRAGEAEACSLDESCDHLAELRVKLAPARTAAAGLLMAFGTRLLIG